MVLRIAGAKCTGSASQIAARRSALQQVPEPATALLIGAGLAAALASGWRNQFTRSAW